ncbi:MAG: M28 family peptidase [Weeksellaceae bacterium]|nr:M28 family peptidase [Weeksellaceae bacterium]
MNKFTFLLIAGVFGSFVNAQYSKEKQTEYVKTLASDDMQGRMFGTEGAKKAADYIAAHFKNNNLKPCVGDSFLITFEHKEKTGYNVCGIQEGKSDEIVAFGAHFDHVGNNGKGEDKIFNGADDNASGTSAVMAISDYYKKKKPKKTIMYMAFDAEEIGLIGSGKLVENPDFATYLPKMEVMYNLEMLGTISEFGLGKVYLTGSDRSDLMKIMNENTCKTFSVNHDPYLGQNLFMRSDNVHFYKKGVVSHSLSSVNMKTAKHYHQPSDEFKVIDMDNLSAITEGVGRVSNKLMKKGIKPSYNK